MKFRAMQMVSTAALALAVCFGAGAAYAETLKAVVGVGPKHTAFVGYQSFAEYVAQNSDLEIKVFSVALLSLKETPPGIRDGLADIGFVVPAYFPAEYAETNLASNLSMFSTAGRKVENPGAAMAGAMTEYLFNCEECLAEYKAQGQVYMGSTASAPYNALCTKPIQTLDDLKGSKMRSPGGNYTRWAESMGAISVTLPAKDQYEGLSQGVIDCTMAPVSDLTNQSLADVTKYVTLGVPGGVFSGAATSNFNIGAWQGLTDDQRTVMLRGAARMQAEMVFGFLELSTKDTERAPDMGVQIIEPSAELVAATDAFVQADKATIEQQFTTDYGVENAAEKIAEVSSLVEKWKDLTADVADDPEALTQVYWDEIFSKIDPTTFGMN